MPQSQERKETIEKSSESREVVEPRLTDVVQKENVIPREIKTWMQKVEEAAGTSPQINDATGQPLLSSPSPVSPQVVLPITRSTFVTGFKKAVSEASHWLSIFLFRLIKIKKGNVKFK